MKFVISAHAEQLVPTVNGYDQRTGLTEDLMANHKATNTAALSSVLLAQSVVCQANQVKQFPQRER
jgi:hypothetical protein